MLKLPKSRPSSHGAPPPDGFSLTELMVAIAVSAVIAIGVTQMTTQYAVMTAQMRRGAEKKTDLKGFSAQFTKLINSATVAVQYQHLPVPLSTACPDPSDPTGIYPRVRQLTTSGTFTCVSAATVLTSPSPGPSPKMEFFRDDDASLASTSVLVKTDQAPLTTSVPISVNSGSFYTTWPLVDDTSAPLMVLRSGGNVSAVYNYACNVDNPATCPGAAPAIQFTVPDTSITSANFFHQLLLIYNALDPTQFMIKQVTAGADPSAGVVNLTLADTSGAGGGLFGFPIYMPDLTAAGLPATINGDWDSLTTPQPGYPFPTTVASIAKPLPLTQLPKLDGSANSLGKYYTTLFGTTDRPNILAVPILATAFYLKKTTVPAGCPSPIPVNGVVPVGCPAQLPVYKLVSKTYQYSGAGVDGGAEITLIEIVTGNLAFARKLGTRSFSSYLTQ